MSKPFHVPMSPEDLPQQRLVEVINLSALPEGVKILAGERDIPAELLDRAAPGKATFLVALEWAWSPMNNRLQGFSLERHGGYWQLWSYFVDFVETGDDPWELSAVCRDKGIDERTAAIHLVIAALIEDIELAGLDHFHWIADCGLLLPADMRVIGETVWPRSN